MPKREISITGAWDTSLDIQGAFAALCAQLREDAAFYRRLHVKLEQWQAGSQGPLTDLLDAMAGQGGE